MLAHPRRVVGRLVRLEVWAPSLDGKGHVEEEEEREEGGGHGGAPHFGRGKKILKF